MTSGRLAGRFLLGALLCSGYLAADAQEKVPRPSIYLMAGVTEADLEGVHTGPALGAIVRFGATRTLGVELDGTLLLIPGGGSCCGSELLFLEPALTVQTPGKGVSAFLGVGGGIGLRLGGGTRGGPTLVGIGGMHGPLSAKTRFRVEARARALRPWEASTVGLAIGLSRSHRPVVR